MQRKLQDVGIIPPSCMLYLFDSCIQPILTYGSDVCVCLWYLRMDLRVEATTSNVITIGECGKFLPSVTCHVNCIMYFLRLRDMSNTSLVNIAFQEQRRLHSLGFVTWYGKVCDLARSYGIDLNRTNCSQIQIRHAIRYFFVRERQESVADINKTPNLRTYVML